MYRQSCLPGCILIYRKNKAWKNEIKGCRKEKCGGLYALSCIYKGEHRIKSVHYLRAFKSAVSTAFKRAEQV